MLALLLLVAMAPSDPPPARIANPGFERGLSGWTAEGHRGFRASPMRIVNYSSDRPAEGRGWLRAGWAARSGAPPGANYRITTFVDAHRYRGRRVRFSAMTRAPDFAHGSNVLTISAGTRTAEARIAASAAWRRHSVTLDIPLGARTIALGFRVERTSAELEADAVRLQVLR